MKFEHVLCVVAGVLSYIGICYVMVALSAQTVLTTGQGVIPPDRFVVVSQQYVESGAKVIVLRDRRQPDRECYVIYEAGAGVVLDAKTPCR